MASIVRTSRLRLLRLIRLNKWKDIGADIALFLLASTQSEEIELAKDILQEINETRKILCELPLMNLRKIHYMLENLRIIPSYARSIFI